MKRLNVAILIAVAMLFTACENFLDVNDNPNAPETVTANLYLPPMLHWAVMAPQWDGRFIGRYTEQWVLPHTTGLPNIWSRHGYDRGSDNGAQQWRDVYWTLGQNLIDLMNGAEAEERWDVLGVGYVLKAWGWLAVTSIHGEIIIQQAFDVTRFAFDYDTQEFAYQEVQRLLDEAIVNLQRDDGAVDVGYLAVGDKIYNGDRTQWLKVAYGLKALAMNHFSNKTSYDPAQVIALVDQSLTGNADDPLFTYPGIDAANADRNFWGRTRGNIASYRQTQFTLELMDGTQFGGVVDPRMTRMLAASPDGEYRGIDPDVGYGALTDDERPNNLHGYPATGGIGQPGRYLFDDNSKIPLITYSQLQFVKAEAALRMGNEGVARTAYLEGISSHIDFVNARNAETGNLTVTQISAQEEADFLASPEINPPTLTLSHIMSQKFIAQWAWGHNELWMDMRRYNYTDMDPVSGTQVFRGFTIPENLDTDNNGLPAQRLRPRFNSEYIWNRDGLDAIGGLAPDYQTKPMWITEQ
jgi:hypothetical protein